MAAIAFDRMGLRDACYYQAGRMAMGERAGFSGWFLVWKNPLPAPGGIAWPSTSNSLCTSDAWLAIFTMGAVASEQFQKGEWVDADDLVAQAEQRGCFEKYGALSHAVRSVAADFAHETIDMVMEGWARIEDYAGQAIDQWSTPDQLESFRIDLMFDDEERQTAPRHFASAIRPGQITKAALVQSTLSTIDQYRA